MATATATHNIPEEILVEILTKLAVKSLFRFKCVSKSWNTLLCEPYFKKKHHNHAKNRRDSQKLLIGAASPGKRDFNFYSTCLSPNHRLFVNDIHKVFWPTISERTTSSKVYCCCDALFLIGIWTGPSRLGDPSMLLLWNPTTSESIQLPPLESLQRRHSTYGLGYDSTSDDYIVLRVDNKGDRQDEILTLKSGSWRKIYLPSTRSSFGNYAAILHGKECLSFLNGAFHWLDYYKCSMSSLNISDDTYRRIPLPKNVNLFPKQHKWDVTIEMGVSILANMLCVFNNNEVTFNLWIMKEYGVQDSWTKLLTLTSNGAISIIPTYSFSDGKMLLRYEYRDDIDRKVLVTNVIYTTCEDQIWSFDYDNIDPRSLFMDGFVYTESLINPKEIKEIDAHRICKEIKEIDAHQICKEIKEIDAHRICKEIKEIDACKEIKEIDTHRICKEKVE